MKLPAAAYSAEAAASAAKAGSYGYSAKENNSKTERVGDAPALPTRLL